MVRVNGAFCTRNHLRATYGYRDHLGRSRCKQCDELAKKGPLTKNKRRPRSFQNTWRWLTSQPLPAIEKLFFGLLNKGILNDKQYKVLRLRFGIDRGGTLRTEQEIANILKVTRTYIHQIESEAYFQITDEAARRRAEKAIANSQWETIP